jgi:hypothetical protein
LGAYESKVVYVNTAASTDGIVEVAGLEYFFDTDPGLGLGTQIATDQALSVSLSNSLNTSGLTKGFHTLYLRGKTPAGRWGAYESKVVYVQPNVPATLLTNRAEYFFDTDPGVGQATQVTFTSTQELNTSINIASQALTKGVHKLYLRAKAENGGWGMYEVANVFVYPDVLTETFETGLPVSNASSTYTLASGSWPATNLSTETTKVRGGTKAARLLKQNASITSPQFSGVSTIEFYYALPAAGTQNFKVMMSQNGGAFTEIASIAATNTTYQKFSQVKNISNATITIKIQTDATAASTQDLLIDDFTGTSINPVLASRTYPGNNGGQVKLDSTFAIVFNQPVIKGTGNIYVIDRADSTVKATIPLSAVTIVNDSAYFSPIALQYDKSYAITISAGAFKEQSNTISFNGIVTNQVWKFQTKSAPAGPSFSFTNVVPATGFTFTNVDAKSKSSATATYQITGQNLTSNISLSTQFNEVSITPFDLSLNGTSFSGTATILQADATNRNIIVRAIVPANNGRTYTGKIIHTANGAQTIEIPISVTELLQSSQIAITAPAANTAYTIGNNIPLERNQRTR